jgi:EF-hand domain-containing family member B
MFSKAGFDYKIGKFNAVYNRAKEIGQTRDDRVSVRDYQLAISEMHNIA